MNDEWDSDIYIIPRIEFKDIASTCFVHTHTNNFLSDELSKKAETISISINIFDDIS